jgi:hypothetical protein
MVTARFLVGTSSDAAVLRVHDKVRANMDRIPVGIPEPLIVGRGIDDVAIVVLTLSPKPEAAAAGRQRPDPRRARAAVEVAKLDDVGLTYLVGEQPRKSASRPIRSARALRHHAAAAGRQGRGRQPRLPGRPGARRRPADRR